MDNFWLILLIVLFGSVVQGITGFGFGLVAMGLLVSFIPLKDAVGLVALLSLVSILYNLLITRREVAWKEAWPIIFAAVPASWLGVQMISWLPVETLKVGVAIMILMGVPVSLWNPTKTRIHKALPWAPVSGVVGGLFGGALNMGGPPVVLYTQLRGWDKVQCKGILSMYFILTALMRVGMHIQSGIIDRNIAIQAAILVIPTLGTAWLGHKLFEQMSTVVFRYVTSALLVILALRIIITSL